MRRFERGDLLDRAFVVGIALKGLDGVLEVLGGVLLLFVTPALVNSIVRALTQHELSEDPNDFIATHILRASGSLSPGSLGFGAAYLLSHGMVKVVLVVAVLRNRLWAYPWMIAFLLLFVAYQLYRLTVSFSIALVGLTVFDLVVTWLTYVEYVKQRRAHAIDDSGPPSPR